MNELILVASLIFIFGTVLFAYRFFGKSGLFAMNAVVTVIANIEVLILVFAFGMEQTLGNVLFAATFLITDILSENEGKKEANKAVNIGIIVSLFMLIITQSWFLYLPSTSDWASEPIRLVFATTPRLMLASMLGYVISQKLDVWLYHKWWDFTNKKFGDKKRFLWLRNNGSTLISQIINTILFNVIAFAGMYNTSTLISIIVSGYLIYVVTSIVDTPVVYLARLIKEKSKIKE